MNALDLSAMYSSESGGEGGVVIEDKMLRLGVSQSRCAERALCKGGRCWLGSTRRATCEGACMRQLRTSWSYTEIHEAKVALLVILCRRTAESPWFSVGLYTQYCLQPTNNIINSAHSCVTRAEAKIWTQGSIRSIGG